MESDTLKKLNSENSSEMDEYQGELMRNIMGQMGLSKT